MRTMFDVKTFFVFLSRNKLYTAINVAGLSVGLMFTILLAVYVRQEYTVDHHQRHLDRIYLFGHRGDLADAPGETPVVSYSNAGFGPVLQQHIPGIEATTAVSFEEDVDVYTDSTSRVHADIIYIDTTFIRIFDLQLTQGDASAILAAPDQAIISERFARQLFGEGDPMGRRLEVPDKKATVTIAGTYRSMGNSVIRSSDLILHLSLPARQRSDFFNYQNHLGSAEVYLLATEGTDLAARQSDFERVLKEVCPTFFDSDTWQMSPVILPLRGLYLSQSESFICRRGNVAMLRVFALVALVVLLFSVMNYVNLTVAQSGHRAREMAVRRLFGAQRWAVAARLIAESVALCLLSLAIGLALAAWLAPAVGRLLGGSIDLAVLWSPTSPSLTLSLLGLAVLVGLLAGAAPAAILSRTRPIQVVRGTFRRTTRLVFSRLFIVIQNLITITLIASALTIYLQIHHMVNAPLGYDHKGIMQIFNPHYLHYSSEHTLGTAAMFRDELLKLPCVEQVALCNNNPLQVGSNGYYLDGKVHWLSVFDVDEHWMPMLGIHLEADYHVAGDSLAYVSPSLLSELGLPRDARDWLPNGDYSKGRRERLRGIVADFRVGSITNHDFDGRGIVIHVYNDLKNHPNWSSWFIKVKGDEEAAYQQVADLYKQTFHEDYYDRWGMGIFLDQQIASFYEDQQRLLNVVSLFAAIAAVISLMGLVAMSTYFIQQRRKEIAVRKVHGSTSLQVWQRLVAAFLLYVVVAFVMAVPLVRHFMGRWLEAYTYRIDLSWWILALAGLACLAVSFAAVAIQSWLAATENPATRLKDL